MVYKDKFVVAVKSNGQILRERDDVVTLPFGSDYSLLLKNLDTRRANVKVTIDGKDALYGSSIVVKPNSELNLLGFLEGSVVRNRFRFIQKTQEIQNHRGDRIDDGIIRVEFSFEIPPEKIRYAGHFPKVEKHDHHYHYHTFHRAPYYDYYPPVIGHDIHWTYNSNTGESSLGGSGDIQVYNSNVGISESVSVPCSSTISIQNIPAEDEGITVKGGQVNQDFSYTSIRGLEDPGVIILKLRGTKTNGTEVQKPLTTREKVECSSCGKSTSSSSKFCPNCGTFLE